MEIGVLCAFDCAQAKIAYYVKQSITAEDIQSEKGTEIIGIWGEYRFLGLFFSEDGGFWPKNGGW